jgi:hypothetical protein
VPPRIFVFTARKPKAQRNLVISIENPLDEETVFGSFAPAYHEELERIRNEGNGFYAWGAVPGLRNIPNWMAMERGDYVLCVYSNTYHRHPCPTHVPRIPDDCTWRELEPRSGSGCRRRIRRSRRGS